MKRLLFLLALAGVAGSFDSQAMAQSSYAAIHFDRGEDALGYSDPENGSTAFESNFYSIPLEPGNASALAAVSDPDANAKPGYQGLPALHAMTMADSSSSVVPFYAAATARFTDQLQATSPTKSTVGILTYTLRFLVDGSLNGNSTASMTIDWGSSGVYVPLTGGVQTVTAVFNTNDLQQAESTDSFGVVTYYDTGLYSEELDVSSESDNGATVSADYSDTAQLEEIDVTDANGNPVSTEFTDGQPGGFDFMSNTNLVVPEPGTNGLLAVAGVALGLVAWRRRFSVKGLLLA